MQLAWNWRRRRLHHSARLERKSVIIALLALTAGRQGYFRR
jgi:hypothetical protein